MRKTKKLVSYLILLAIPVAIAVALFVFNGSGYRLSEQDAADIAYKNAGVQTSEISQSAISKLRIGLHGSYSVSFTTPDNHFEYTIDGQSGSILKHKSDHPTSKDEDDTKKVKSLKMRVSLAKARMSHQYLKKLLKQQHSIMRDWLKVL